MLLIERREIDVQGVTTRKTSSVSTAGESEISSDMLAAVKVKHTHTRALMEHWLHLTLKSNF